MKATLLEAISPTARALLAKEVHFYPCNYSWNDPVFGLLSASTVITGWDEEAALAAFRSRHRHVTSAAIVKEVI